MNAIDREVAIMNDADAHDFLLRVCEVIECGETANITLIIKGYQKTFLVDDLGYTESNKVLFSK